MLIQFAYPDLIYPGTFVLCLGFIFFFKQKTAYELRISDWSSDVCSSDLITASVSSTGNATHHNTSTGAICAASRWLRKIRLQATRKPISVLPASPMQILRPSGQPRLTHM